MRGPKGDKGDKGDRGPRGYRGRSFSGYEPRALGIYTAWLLGLIVMILINGWHL